MAKVHHKNINNRSDRIELIQRAVRLYVYCMEKKIDPRNLLILEGNKRRVGYERYGLAIKRIACTMLQSMKA
jgi:hypothetical protein